MQWKCKVPGNLPSQRNHSSSGSRRTLFTAWSWTATFSPCSWTCNSPNTCRQSKLVDYYCDSSSLTLYQPMTHICIMSSHKPIRMYMGGLILGVNTLYRLFCFFKLFPMVGKGLMNCKLFSEPNPRECGVILIFLDRAPCVIHVRVRITQNIKKQTDKKQTQQDLVSGTKTS